VHGRLSVVSVVCCQVEVSATDLSLVQRSPTDCGVLLCVIKKPRKNEEAKARNRAVENTTTNKQTNKLCNPNFHRRLYEDRLSNPESLKSASHFCVNRVLLNSIRLEKSV
jgi:hypothetical protein